VDRELVEKLGKVKWGRVILELTWFSSGRIKKLSWKHGWKGDHIPKGLEPADIAMEAISTVFDERRHWDSVKYPNLMDYLKSVANSLISHLYESKEYELTDRFLEDEEGSEQIPLPADPEAVTQLTPDPEETLLGKEEDQIGEELFNQLLDFLKDDDELGEIILCIREGYTKPAQIAQQLDVDVKEIYTRKRRLQRRFTEFQISMRREEGYRWQGKTEKEAGTRSA
jgi:hypothetical protein